MSFGDGIAKINSYSLTDFHDFESCSFRFFVRHHLDKKYEIEEGSKSLALGSLLDQSIKKFHKSKAYGQSLDYLANLVRAAINSMKEDDARKPKPSFYTNTIPFLTEELFEKAVQIFKNFYSIRQLKINQSIAEVGFCEVLLDINGIKFKLWGGPDTLELGDDGIPEIIDYKSRENLENVQFDMDLMPKIYTLLCSKNLLKRGYKKARFKVRIWQDPLKESFYEEFDLENLSGIEFLFKQKIEKILATKQINFCEGIFCKACKSPKRDEYLGKLKNLGLNI